MEGQQTLMDTDDLDKLAQGDTAPKAPKAPKAKAAPKATSTGARRGRPPKSTINIRTQAEQSLSSLGGMLVVAGTVRQSPHLMYDGQVIVARAGDVAAELDELAKSNPQVKRALERMFTTSSWAKVATTFAGVLVPIAACHGVVPQPLAIPFVPQGLTMDMPPPPARKPPQPKSAPRPQQQQPRRPQAPQPEPEPSNGFGPAAASGLPDAP